MVRSARAARRAALALALLLASPGGCMLSSGGTRAGGSSDGDADLDEDLEADAEPEADLETDADGDAGEDADLPPCPEGEARCDGLCLDVLADRLNCGRCDHACAPLETCAGGECLCEAPYLLCEGACVDPSADSAHCGGCGAPCPAGAECLESECLCAGELTNCLGECVDTDASSEHCGGCEAPCGLGYLCDGTGSCAVDCAAGFDLCFDASGGFYCADLSADPADCDECGHRCPAPDHGLATCLEGLCGFECEPGWGDADGDRSNGCECRVTGAEVCDGLDNDCNGTADEDFECVLGESEPCLGGSSGACSGTRLCVDSGGVCLWGACLSASWECLAEGVGRPCTRPGTTGCAGTEVCRADCTWGACSSPAWECLPGEAEPCTPAGTFCPGSRSCGADCAFGPCGETCEEPTPDCCEGGCTDLASDPASCGTCGLDCGGESCCAGSCEECCEEADCDDGEPCTVESCDLATLRCERAVLPDATACEGGLCCGAVCRLGGECCTAVDCPAAPGACTGTATRCSAFGTIGGCEAQLGCYWNASPPAGCRGTPWTCESMADGCRGCGCNWNASTGACTGSPASCGSLSPTGLPSCLECGCDLLDGACTGAADSCGSNSCSGQAGCAWHVPAAVCSDWVCG